jgi:putative transposase
MLQNDFKKHQICMGRDRLFDFLREEYLLVPKTRRYYKTTNSRHWMKKYPNFIQQTAFCRPEQVWVADITYLRTKEKTYYLHLVTDVYLKKIVGYKLADNLMAAYTLEALKHAVKSRKYTDRFIHHCFASSSKALGSGRGLQYCTKENTEYLIKKIIQISMTQSYDPNEITIAESVNGILKEEFGLFETFENYENLKNQDNQTIFYYNKIRLHLSINMLTPNKAHLQNEVKLKQWGK